MITAAHTPITVQQRQQVLCLWPEAPDLDAQVIAWSLWDGAGEAGGRVEDPTPPYATPVAAMRDGWRVMHMALPHRAPAGTELQLDYLPNAVLLERLVEVER